MELPEVKWGLKEVSDFFYLLIDLTDTSGKDILQRRFKKAPDALDDLYSLIEQIDSFGYKEGIEFAFKTSHFDTIKSSIPGLIEIRKFSGTWRVLTYHDLTRKKLVMLDAFEAHKNKSTGAAAKSVGSKVAITIRLLEKD